VQLVRPSGSGVNVIAANTLAKAVGNIDGGNFGAAYSANLIQDIFDRLAHRLYRNLVDIVARDGMKRSRFAINGHGKRRRPMVGGVVDEFFSHPADRPGEVGALARELPQCLHHIAAFVIASAACSMALSSRTFASRARSGSNRETVWNRQQHGRLCSMGVVQLQGIQLRSPTTRVEQRAFRFLRVAAVGDRANELGVAASIAAARPTTRMYLTVPSGISNRCS
jgi:hypothetical protein